LVLDGAPEAMAARLKDPAARAKVVAAMPEAPRRIAAFMSRRKSGYHFAFDASCDLFDSFAT
jgi:hypothetical protein